MQHVTIFDCQPGKGSRNCAFRLQLFQHISMHSLEYPGCLKASIINLIVKWNETVSLPSLSASTWPALMSINWARACCSASWRRLYTGQDRIQSTAIHWFRIGVSDFSKINNAAHQKNVNAWTTGISRYNYSSNRRTQDKCSFLNRDFEPGVRCHKASKLRRKEGRGGGSDWRLPNVETFRTRKKLFVQTQVQLQSKICYFGTKLLQTSFNTNLSNSLK